MIELSQSSQLTQQIVNFRLTSDQYLLSSSLRYRHFFHGIDDTVELVSALEDNTIPTLAENA